MIQNLNERVTWGGTVMTGMDASGEVLRLIGTEILQRLSMDAYSSYRCVKCGKAGRTVQPTTVVGYRYWRNIVAVELPHAECPDSGIVHVDAAPPADVHPDRGRAHMRNLTMV